MSVWELQVETEEFRIVLVLPWSKMLLVEHHDGNHQLPRLTIRRWARIAEQLNQTVRAKWDVRSVVIDLLPMSCELPRCAVIEVRTHYWKFALSGLEPVSIDDLDEKELTAPERQTICSIIAANPQDRGPFSRLGWIEEAQEWIRESVVDHRVDFNEDVRQAGAGGYFALVRFGTVCGPAYWLKATAAPNSHEFSITTAFARYFPDYLPPQVTARQDWGAWVMEEMGLPLRDSVSLYAFEQAAHCLAQLQRASVDHVEMMLAKGCFDQRMPIVRAHLPDLTQYLEEAMARQISTRVRPIERNRLHELGRVLEEAFHSMEMIGIPDALTHNDMNTDNILFDGERAVFTDWAEAYIGNPFFTFQHLWAQAHEADTTHTWALRLKTIYQEHWRSVLDEVQIKRALTLCPPLALASYLCGRDVSFISEYRTDIRYQGYARSLARRIDRAAQAPEFLEAICN